MHEPLEEIPPRPETVWANDESPEPTPAEKLTAMRARHEKISALMKRADSLDKMLSAVNDTKCALAIGYSMPFELEHRFGIGIKDVIRDYLLEELTKVHDEMGKA